MTTFLYGAGRDLEQAVATHLFGICPNNRNARRIARLDAGRVEAFNRVFRARRDVLDWFGYDLMAAHRADR